MKRIGLLFLVVVMAFGVVLGTAGCGKDDADPVGTWAFAGDIGCDGNDFALTFHIFSNGTFSDSDADNGIWTVDKDDITLTYASGIVVLVGEVDDNQMVGTWSGISAGCWTAVRTSKTP